MPQMRIHGSQRLGHARFHVGEKPDQPANVVALGKALSMEQAARLELVERQQESICRNQIDGRVAWPSRQQRLQTREAVLFPHRHAPRDADDERHAGLAEPRKASGDPMEFCVAPT